METQQQKVDFKLVEQIFIGGIMTILYLIAQQDPSASTSSKKGDNYKRWCFIIFHYHDYAKGSPGKH